MKFFVLDGSLKKMWANGTGNLTDAELSTRLQEYALAMASLTAKSQQEGQTMNAADAEQFEGLYAQYCSHKAELERRNIVSAVKQEIESPAGRSTDPEAPGAGADHAASAVMVAQAQGKIPKPRAAHTRVEGGNPVNLSNGGFQNLGEFASAVKNASASAKGLGGSVDPRLMYNAPGSLSTSQIDADGGYAIPPDFREEIKRKVFGEASLIGLTDQQTSSSNSITFPKDSTTPWSTAGIQAGWTGEGTQIAQSKVSFGEDTIKLHKIAVLVPVTEELLEDAPAVGRYIMSKVPDVMGFALNNAIINGDNIGKPQGILQSGSLIAVPKAPAQVAGTINYENIVEMWSSMHAPGQSNAIWIAHPQISKQLMLMKFPSELTGIPVYLPPSGAAGSPYSKLFGRDIITTEACPIAGSKGDIILADMKQYMTVQKTSGLRADTSIHLFFDFDVMAFRFILRFGGKSWWDAPITGKAASVKYSPFIAIEDRA